MMQQAISQQLPKRGHEIWVVTHPSVYSQGQAGKPEHVLNTSGIQLQHADRGGQVTYHGPGQLVCYFLFDLNALNLNIRELVQLTSDSVVNWLGQFGIKASDDSKHPGVYVGQQKIASLGFRVRRHMSYHGIAINLQMDLRPFAGINPCGRQQPIVQVADLLNGRHISLALLTHTYINEVVRIFGFENVIVTRSWPVL